MSWNRFSFLLGKEGERVIPPSSQIPVSLSIVVPCYNEEDVLRGSARVLVDTLSKMVSKELVSEDSEILFVDDGSTDSTWRLVQELAVSHECINGLKLSRNFGHQAALLAGLMSVERGISISLDADLQDDPCVIEQMVKAFYEGCDIVYGVRESREVDSFGKRVTARLYYKFLRAMGVEIIEDHADFRLMSAKALRELSRFTEVNLFLRGIVPMIGLPSRVVKYSRKERLAGETKYSLSKMFALALDGVAAFSSVPLRVIAWLGAGISIASIFFALWAVGVKLFGDGVVPGWASTVVPIYFIGGVQLLSLGIIGAYLSRMYGETKSRPRYIVDHMIKSGRNNRTPEGGRY